MENVFINYLLNENTKNFIVDLQKNVTIEERVSLLELQVVDLDEDVDFLFDEQVIQDERLLGLENRALDVETRMLDVENEVEGSHLRVFKKI